MCFSRFNHKSEKVKALFTTLSCDNLWFNLLYRWEIIQRKKLSTIFILSRKIVTGNWKYRKKKVQKSFTHSFISYFLPVPIHLTFPTPKQQPKEDINFDNWHEQIIRIITSTVLPFQELQTYPLQFIQRLLRLN